MNGTSIDNLRNQQDMGQASYGAQQNMHYEQGHNAAHQVHQAQHNPYYDVPDNMGYPQFNKPVSEEGAHPGYLTPQQIQQIQQIQQKKELDIEELTKDINENIPEDTFFSLGEPEEESQSGGVLSFLPKEWREPLLLLVIYLLFSQPIVRQTLGNYITQLNPDAEGKIGFAGVLIYGIILVTIYFLAKRYLIN
jgi:hypothetical protein